MDVESPDPDGASPQGPDSASHAGVGFARLPLKPPGGPLSNGRHPGRWQSRAGRATIPTRFLQQVLRPRQATSGRWTISGSGSEGVGMRRFHHVGIITDQARPGEIIVARTEVHVTNPAGSSTCGSSPTARSPARCGTGRTWPSRSTTWRPRSPESGSCWDRSGRWRGCASPSSSRTGLSSSSCSSTPRRRSTRSLGRGRGEMTSRVSCSVGPDHRGRRSISPGRSYHKCRGSTRGRPLAQVEGSRR
jgi:hypothetical protein